MRAESVHPTSGHGIKSVVPTGHSALELTTNSDNARPRILALGKACLVKLFILDDEILIDLIGFDLVEFGGLTHI